MVNKKNISDYPFGKNIKKPDTVYTQDIFGDGKGLDGKNIKSPDYYYTQDIFGDGAGITGRKKKNKKNFVSNKINVKEKLTQLSVKK
jgi:predicted RNA-binding protein